MSVIIKKVDIPNCCGKCDFRRTTPEGIECWFSIFKPFKELDIGMVYKATDKNKKCPIEDAGCNIKN